MIFGASEGGNMSMLFAAAYPERTIALCTFGSTAKRLRTADYPWAPTWEERQDALAWVDQWTSGLAWDDVAPSLDPAGLAELRATPALCEPRRGGRADAHEHVRRRP